MMQGQFCRQLLWLQRGLVNQLVDFGCKYISSVAVFRSHLRSQVFTVRTYTNRCPPSLRGTIKYEWMSNVPSKVNFLTGNRFYCESTNNVWTKTEKKLNVTGTSEETDDGLKQVIQEIYDSCCKVDRMFESRGIGNVKRVVDVSLQCGLSLDQIQKLYAKSPVLVLKCNIANISNLLQQYGLQPSEIATMCCKDSQILTLKNDAIIKSMESMREVGISNEAVLKILRNNPGFLLISPKEIIARFMSLRSVFDSKQRSKIFEKTPVVLMDDLNSILEKFNYAHEVMGVSHEQIVESSLFVHSITHIRNRHLFVTRAGFFKKLRKKKKGQIDSNPPLTDIIDMSDRQFLKHFGNMSVSDYNMFCALVDIEMKEKKFNDKLENTDDEMDY